MIFVPLFTTWMALLSAIGGAVAELMGHVVACILPLKNTLTVCIHVHCYLLFLSNIYSDF